MVTWRVRVGFAGMFLVGVACGFSGLMLVQRGASPLAHAQSAGCSVATLNGVYGSLVHGFNVRGADGMPLSQPVPRSTVNVLTFDGAGNVSRIGTANIGGVVNPNPATGTYVVEQDCTFNVIFTLPNGTLAPRLTGMLVDGGRRAFVVNTGPEAVLNIVYERQ